MPNKKLLISAIALLLLLGIGSFVYIKFGKKNVPTTTPTQTNSNSDTQVASGGYKKNNFVIVQDPSQPYAGNLPRSSEPVPDKTYKPKKTGANSGGSGSGTGTGSNPGTGTGSNSGSGTGTDNSGTGTTSDHDQAVAMGLIPDENGEYTQVVDPSGWNPNMTQVNYSLSQADFLQTYLPNYKDVISGNTAGQQALAGQDAPILVASGSDAFTDTPSIPDSVFKVSSDNSTIALDKYLQDMTAATNGLDLVYDSNATYSILNGGVSLDQVYTVIARIKEVTVPDSFLPLSKSYLDLYEKFALLGEKQKTIFTSANQQEIDLYTSALNNYFDAIDLVDNNINAAKQILGTK